MRGHIRKRSKNACTIVVDVGRDPATGKRCQLRGPRQGFMHKPGLGYLNHRLDAIWSRLESIHEVD